MPVLCLALAACQSELASNVDPDLGVSPSPIMVGSDGDVPRGGGYKMVGKPYQVAGRWYHPEEDEDYEEIGRASWYGKEFHGRRTANGEIFDRNRLTGAHPTLPLPSYVRVTNLANDRSVIVRINDRGPFHNSRIIDVSARTAEMLQFKRAGRAKVKVEYVGPARLDGKDENYLLASFRESGGRDHGAGPVQVAASTLGGWFGRGSADDDKAGKVPAAKRPATARADASDERRRRATPKPAAAPSAVAYAPRPEPNAAIAASEMVAEGDTEVLESLLQQHEAAQRAVGEGASTTVDPSDPMAGLIGDSYLRKRTPVGPTPTAWDDERVGGAHDLFAIVDNTAASE